MPDQEILKIARQKGFDDPITAFIGFYHSVTGKA
jgi:hypothetical protein